MIAGRSREEENELGFNYLSLLFTDGRQLNPDLRLLFIRRPQTLAHPASGNQLRFSHQRQTADLRRWKTNRRTVRFHFAGLDGSTPARKFPFTDAAKSNGLIDGKFFSITRPFTTLNCSSLPVAFSISSAGLQITQGMSTAAMPLPCCLLTFLFAISCKWRKRGSVFFPHGSRSHNLIHLCDKLHYEGSR